VVRGRLGTDAGVIGAALTGLLAANGAADGAANGAADDGADDGANDKEHGTNTTQRKK
jgi:hypothetical protein